VSPFQNIDKMFLPCSGFYPEQETRFHIITPDTDPGSEILAQGRNDSEGYAAIQS